MSYGTRAAAPELMSTAEVARELGLSYRIVDYWCRTSRVLCPTVVAQGSGSARGWSEEDFGRMTKAACLHRALIKSSEGRGGGSNGVTVEFLERFVVEAIETVGGWVWATPDFSLTVRCR